MDDAPLLDEPACRRVLADLDPACAERWRESPLAAGIARVCAAPEYGTTPAAFGYGSADGGGR